MATKDIESKKNTEELLNFTPTEVSFRMPDKRLEGKGKKSPRQRLAECLEERANNEFTQRNYEAAVNTLTEIIDLFPDRSYIHSNRASCHLRRGWYQKSLEDGRKAVLIDQANVEGWICVGESQLALGNPSACLEELEKILEDTSDHCLKNLILKLRQFSSIVKKAEKAFEENDFDTSLSLYEAASKIAGENQALKQKMFACKAFKEELSLEDSLAKITFKENDTEADSFYLKGMIHYYQNQKDEAFENFDKCLSIDEGHERCQELYLKARNLFFMRERGNEYFKKKKYNLAIESYLKGLNVDPRNKTINAEINFSTGVTHLRKFKIADALRYINAAISLNGKYTNALLKRAEIYLDVNQIRDAISDLEKVCEISPSFINTKLLDEAKNKLKLAPMSRKEFCSLNEEEQNKILAESCKEKGNELYRNRQYDRAMELYNEAVNLEPSNPFHYSNRSACHIMMKRYKEAMIDASNSLDLDSSFVKAYIRKGKAALALGKGKDALQTFEQGLMIDTKNGNLKDGRDKASKLLTFILKGDEAKEKKNFYKAADLYGAARKIAEGSSELLMKRLEALLYGNKFRLANELCKELPEDSNYYYILALGYYLQCHNPAACDCLRKALEMDPDNLKCKNLQRMVKEITNLHMEAFAMLFNSSLKMSQDETRLLLKRARYVDPNNDKLGDLTTFLTAQCYNKELRFRASIDILSNAIESRDFVYESYLERALCYRHLGKWEDCVKDLERAHRAMPDNDPIREELLNEAKAKLKFGQRDFYLILGIDPNATNDDIRQAHETLKKNNYNLLYVDDGSNVEVNIILEAFDILNDPLKRGRYDRASNYFNSPYFVESTSTYFFHRRFPPSFNPLNDPNVCCFNSLNEPYDW